MGDIMWVKVRSFDDVALFLNSRDIITITEAPNEDGSHTVRVRADYTYTITEHTYRELLSYGRVVGKSWD